MTTRPLTGTPWDTFDARVDPEPYPVCVYYIADLTGLDPKNLNWHVEAIHGWEPHDVGYRAAVVTAAGCLLAGGCK